MSIKKYKKVFVGLSGGVDSSVSALLLKRSGYDVTGVFIRVWQPDFFECTWKDDRLDAMRVAAKLGIPFMELDLEKEYKKQVVDYMVREYKAGKTPNPDVMCNRFIKFGGFYDYARKNGADFVATGHYARIKAPKRASLLGEKGRFFGVNGQWSMVNGFGLFAGSDPQKDQSYFLWQIRKEQLPHILFPVGDMKKTEVRSIAKKAGLITADKKDSQGLCFVGKVDMKDFLSHYIREREGTFVDEKGTVLGEHKGAFFYTIGERAPISAGKALYVTGKDIRTNTVTVSGQPKGSALFGSRTRIHIAGSNWLAKPVSGKSYSASTRYRQPLQSCKFEVKSSKVIFERPQAVASGQSLVLYDGERCIGGGVIAD